EPRVEPRDHGRDDIGGDLGMSDLQLPKLRPEEDEQANGRRAPDGRRAPTLAEDRDLAEEVPRAERRERVAVDAYLGCAVEHDEERVARSTLADEADPF